MHRRRTHAVLIAAFALVAPTLGVTQASADESTSSTSSTAARSAARTVPAGFRDVLAIGGLSEPVGVAFAADGTAFVALKTGVVKSFDYNAAAQAYEPGTSATDFVDLTVPVNNYGDRGLTGITVDPQFPARPYVYVNYTFNKDPGPTQAGAPVPRWGQAGVAYDECGTDDVNEASLSPAKRGCPVTIRVSRLTAARGPLGWSAVPGSELVLLENGCAQFSSHASGDVAFGPDGKLYASAGDGASFRGQDFGQADNAGYAQGPACGDPVDEGGSLRAQDQRTGGDALGVDGTIFRLDPNTKLNPTQATADQWLVALGQRNPWRLTFRQDREQLWSVDVGSSNWEEINQLIDAPSTGLVNRGWPCYEGTTGTSTRNAAWDALDKPICEDLYAVGPGAVQAPVFAYPTTNSNRTATVPLTPGENCPAVSSSLSGVAFSQLGTDWPAAYQDALYFSDFLRGCVWRMEKDANGQPNPAAVRLFVEGAGSPVDVLPGPGGDLFYLDYGTFTDAGYAAGSGGLHRVEPATAAATTTLAVKSKPRKVGIKVNGTKVKAPWSTELAPGTKVVLKAPRAFSKGKAKVRYVFKKWKGVKGKKAKKRKLTLTVGASDVTVKAVYVTKRKRR